MGFFVHAIASPRRLAGAAAILNVLLFALVISAGGDALGALQFAIGGSLLLGAGLWLWLKGVEEAINRRAIGAMGSTGRKPGDWVAVAGRAVPLGETMKATVSGREALACSYEVTEKQRGMTNKSSTGSVYIGILYEGHHLVPTGIETDSGTVPLRALPDLVNLEKSGFGKGEARIAGTAERLDKSERRAARRSSSPAWG
jgi:hypothetical protein